MQNQQQVLKDAVVNTVIERGMNDKIGCRVLGVGFRGVKRKLYFCTPCSETIKVQNPTKLQMLVFNWWWVQVPINYPTPYTQYAIPFFLTGKQIAFPSGCDFFSKICLHIARYFFAIGMSPLWTFFFQKSNQLYYYLSLVIKYYSLPQTLIISLVVVYLGIKKWKI